MAAIAVIAAALLGPALAPAPISAIAASDGARPMPLIHIDDELGGYLKMAAEFVEKEDYGQAVEILQALLERTDQPFVPTSDVRRFVSLAARATRAIGDLPAEGLSLYRQLYDTRAEVLYRQAAEAMDVQALRELIRHYLHTSVGDDALNLLGAVHFDQGEFSQAANRWRDILNVCKNADIAHPLLLAKIATAHHYAGENRRAMAALAELESKHSEAQAVLGGAKTNVLSFTRGILDSPPPKAVGTEVLDGWPSLAGAPDSMAIMKPCKPVLSQRWVVPGGKAADNPTVKSLLQSTKATSNSYIRYGPTRQPITRKAVLREGHVVVVSTQGTRVANRIALPPLVHPVVVGTRVFYRADGKVVSYDLLTGGQPWGSMTFPMHKEPDPKMSRGYNPYGVYNVCDQGRYTLSVGDGKVYAVGGFIPISQQMFHHIGRQTTSRDDSILRAFSLSGQLRLAWSVGGGEGSADILRSCKYMGAPTYSAGRLYVMAAYMQSYYLLCLDSRDGALVWSVMIAQQPVADPRYGGYANWVGERGSPPAVADGRVFATTNAGVAAAFEADTGRAIWAYQYQTRGPESRGRSRAAQVRRMYPPNPIIAVKGKAVFLPADSEEMLVLRADTGELVGKGVYNRQGQFDLTAADETRMILTGPKFYVLDLASGEMKQIPGVDKLVGRPAVTSEAVLASATGWLVAVSMKDMSVQKKRLVQADGILGHLVSVHGKLIAANAAGLAGYFPYGSFRAELTKRLAKAPPERVPDLLYRRGMNAFNANRPAEGVRDLKLARQKAEALGQDSVIVKAGQGLYRAYVALANAAVTNAKMFELFKTAAGYAYSDRSRGEMVVRMIKYYGRVGQTVRAVELAHRLAVDYDKTDLVNVDIGDAADPHVRDDPDTPRLPGAKLGHVLIKALIDKHGRLCYAGFDAQAKTALAAAAKAGDAAAMVAVTNKYPHSTWAPAALLAAGETQYHKGVAAGVGGGRNSFKEAGRLLIRLAAEYADSPQAPSAAIGRAAIYKGLGHKALGYFLHDLRTMPPDTRVAFASLRGTLAKVLPRFDGDLGAPPRTIHIGRIDPPLGEMFADTETGVILRDKDDGVIHLGEKVFLLRGAKLSLFDPAADSIQAGIEWTVNLPLDMTKLYRSYTGRRQSFLCGITDDEKILTIGCRGGVIGVDVKKRKVIWRLSSGDSRVSRMYGMGYDDGRFALLESTGGIRILDVRTGKEVWAPQLPRKDMPWRAPPQMAAGLMVVLHGSRMQQATVFDVESKRLLGTIPLAPRYCQAYLSREGLLILNDGQTLKLIEPILDIDRPLQTLKLAGAVQPVILAVADGRMILSPSASTHTIQIRDLKALSRDPVKLTLANPKGAGTAMPFRAWVRGKRLYILAGQMSSSYRYWALMGQLPRVRNATLQAFDMTTGRRVWVTGVGLKGNSYDHIMPPDVGVAHMAISSIMASSFTRPSELKIVRLADGAIVQRIPIPAIAGGKKVPHGQYVLPSHAAVFGGRLVLETHKGVKMFGPRKVRAPDNANE